MTGQRSVSSLVMNNRPVGVGVSCYSLYSYSEGFMLSGFTCFLQLHCVLSCVCCFVLKECCFCPLLTNTHSSHLFWCSSPVSSNVLHMCCRSPPSSLRLWVTTFPSVGSRCSLHPSPVLSQHFSIVFFAFFWTLACFKSSVSFMTLFLQPDKTLKYKLWALHVPNKRDPTSPRDRIYGSKLLFLLVCRSSKVKKSNVAPQSSTAHCRLYSPKQAKCNMERWGVKC